MKHAFLFLALISSILMPSCSGQKKASTFGTDNKKAFEYFGQALLARDVNDDEEALEYLAKALKKDPYYTDALNLTAELLAKKKDFDGAIDHYLRILQINPEYLYALDDLSQLYFDLNRYDDCLRLLNRMLPLVGMSDKRAEVQMRIESAEFAKYAVAHPVPFKPVNVGSVINTEQEEYFPALSTDENLLYFTRRDGSLNVMEQNEDIFVSTKANGGWSQATNLGKPINTIENEGAFSASPDGKYLYFTSCVRPGGVGKCDIWVAKLEDNKWSEPVNLGRPLNTRNWETQPSISADGKTLYFVSDRPDGYGGSDIWYSTKTPQGWSNPKNLGPKINTKGDEQFPYIHTDGQTLYFASTGLPGMGKSDIYITRKVNQEWMAPVNLGYPINTHGDEWNFMVNRTGDMAFFASDGIEGSFGGMDIYSMELYELARPSSTGYVKGIVFDIDTKEKIQASVDLYDLASGEVAATTFSDQKTGSFLVNLPSNANYAFETQAEGYLFHSENFSLIKSSLSDPFILEIGLKKIAHGQPMVLNNIFFDVDEWEIKEESKVELQIVVDFMTKNANIRVEFGGHTDNTGSESTNQLLSENRAQAVYMFLVSSGIDKNRMTFKGYGSSQPVADNNTVEGRALNRRTELKIIE